MKDIKAITITELLREIGVDRVVAAGAVSTVEQQVRSMIAIAEEHIGRRCSAAEIAQVARQLLALPQALLQLADERRAEELAPPRALGQA